MAEKDLIKSDEMIISISEDNPDYWDTRRWRRLESSDAIELSGMLQAIPAAAHAFDIGRSYTVTFPKGIGELLRKNNGHYQATLVNDQHKFVANAELVENRLQAVSYSVFQVLSIVTQQYYLHEINQQLTNLCKKLDQVLDFLYTDKACELYAEAQAIQFIYSNYASIMKHPEQRIVALQTIQHAKILAERNTQFYIRDINGLANSIVQEHRRICDDLNSYTQTISLYGVCSVLEIMISQNYDQPLLSYVESDLKSHYDKHNKNISELKGRVDGAVVTLKAGKPAAILGIQISAAPNPAPIENLQKEITEILGDQSPVRDFNDTIKRIQEAISAPAEYRIAQNGDVYQKL